MDPRMNPHAIDFTEVYRETSLHAKNAAIIAGGLLNGPLAGIFIEQAVVGASNPRVKVPELAEVSLSLAEALEQGAVRRWFLRRDEIVKNQQRDEVVRSEAERKVAGSSSHGS